MRSWPSGVTVSTGARRGTGLVLTLLAGYPAPSLLGLAGALSVASDHAWLMLVVATGLLAVTLAVVRNVYGGLAVLATGVLIGFVAVGQPRVCRTASPRRSVGSCCSVACAPPVSCARAAVAAPTPTCSPG